MANKSPALVASIATLQFLDFASNFINKVCDAEQPAKNIEPTEIEREADKLKEVDSTVRAANQTASGVKLSDTENALLGIYDRCKALADRLVPGLLKVNEQGTDATAKGKKVVDPRKPDAEKYKKEVDALRTDCAVQLYRLLSMSYWRGLMPKCRNESLCK